MNYDLHRANGNFIIASNPDNHVIKLFELTKEMLNPIATELILSDCYKDRKFDVCNSEPKQILQYDKDGCNF